MFRGAKIIRRGRRLLWKVGEIRKDVIMLWEESKSKKGSRETDKASGRAYSIRRDLHKIWEINSSIQSAKLFGFKRMAKSAMEKKQYSQIFLLSNPPN
jgi:hypothetical protein